MPNNNEPDKKNAYQIIAEEIDIYEYPQNFRQHPLDHHLAIGDLHANAIKLIHFLISEGVLKIEKSVYAIMVQAYKDYLFSVSEISDLTIANNNGRINEIQYLE